MKSDNSKPPRKKSEEVDPKVVNTPMVQTKKANNNLQQDGDDESTPGTNQIDDTNAG